MSGLRPRLTVARLMLVIALIALLLGSFEYAARTGRFAPDHRAKAEYFSVFAKLNEKCLIEVEIDRARAVAAGDRRRAAFLTAFAAGARRNADQYWAKVRTHRHAASCPWELLPSALCLCPYQHP